MATTTPLIDANNAELLASGTRYRKEIIVTPLLKIEDVYGKYTTRRIGIRGKETVGKMHSGAQVRPSTLEYNATKSTSIKFRTLETFVGDVIEEFSPQALAQSIYGEQIGKNAKDFNIVKAVALAMAGSVGDNLVNCLFSAVRNASGTTSSTLFDGFYTILSKEITAETLSTTNKNMMEIPAITADNVLDVLKSIYLKSSLKLRRKKKTLMFVPQAILDLYNEAYLAEVGPVPYNQQYEQVTLLGSNGRCELVPVYDDYEDAPIFVTTKDNMLIGCDQLSDEEKAKIREVDNPKLVQFFMIMYFGVQFEQIDADSLFVGVVTEEEEDTDDTNQNS